MEICECGRPAQTTLTLTEWIANDNLSDEEAYKVGQHECGYLICKKCYEEIKEIA